MWTYHNTLALYPNGLNEFWRGTSHDRSIQIHSAPRIQTTILPSLLHFIHYTGLCRPTSAPHTITTGQSGFRILPLWDFNPSSRFFSRPGNLDAWLSLYASLDPLLYSAGAFFRMLHPATFARARSILLHKPEPRFELLGGGNGNEMNCFESVRIAVNMHIESDREGDGEGKELETFHESRYAVVTVLGDWGTVGEDGGQWRVEQIEHEIEGEVWLDPGDLAIVGDNLRVQVRPHDGLRIQVEFFLPEGA